MKCEILLALCVVGSVSAFSPAVAAGPSGAKQPGVSAKKANNSSAVSSGTALGQVRIKLPSGETVTAVRIPGPKNRPPEGAEIIVKGVIGMDRDGSNEQLVLRSETGIVFLLANAPYVNTLRFKAFGKIATVKGQYIHKTSFKGSPALYIKDILKISDKRGQR